MVIFTGGKFREDVVKTSHMGVIFTIFYLSLNKVLWGLLTWRGNFREEGHVMKNAKITPMEKNPH